MEVKVEKRVRVTKWMGGDDRERLREYLQRFLAL